MTVLELIQRSTEFLARKGVESARLESELLIGHVLRVPRLKLYLNFDRSLTEADVSTMRELVKRRGRREPLQHILGSTSFCGLEFIVNANVLVPRPETEILAEKAWEFLQKLSYPDRQKPGQQTVLDFGTGSGVLAVTLAVKCPHAVVHAIDISDAALAVARQNAQHHRVLDRVHFYLSDGFANIPAQLQFHLLVANPPYIPRQQIPRLAPEVREHDPLTALEGGEDGLLFYRRIAAEARPFMAPASCVMLEFGDGQDKAVAEIFSEQNWRIDDVVHDLSRRPRILIAHPSSL